MDEFFFTNYQPLLVFALMNIIDFPTHWTLVISKIVSEYDQEMSQSHTTEPENDNNDMTFRTQKIKQPALSSQA